MLLAVFTTGDRSSSEAVIEIFVKTMPRSELASISTCNPGSMTGSLMASSSAVRLPLTAPLS